MIAVTTFAGRTIAVFGMARSGLAAARALIAGGAAVACWDDGENGRAAATAAGLPLVDLRVADWSHFAALVLTPGVPLTHPEPHWTVCRAQDAGVEVIGDTELFFRELTRLPEGTRPKTVGITGTNGKSTTTALIAHLLRHAGKRVAMGGNIGEAVLGLAPFADVDVYVLELSSYQIDLTPTLHADVGILLNLSPDHLDRHGGMEHYAEVKERLVTGARTAIVGLDEPWARAIAARRLAAGGPLMALHVETDSTRPAGAVRPTDVTPFLREGILAVAPDRDLPTLRGPHNAQNAAAANCATLALYPDLDQGVVLSGLGSFPGLAHRMELLGSIGDVAFINDSKATNADATAKALNSWGSNLHWIVGGRQKDGGIDSLVPFFERVGRVYLIGESSAKFAETIRNYNQRHCRVNGPISILPCDTLEYAMRAVWSFVEQNQGPNVQAGTVLLSPACASFDQFKDFEDRGDQFRKLVAALPGFVPYGARS
jgi:UDP-N-acetylmuramoylalanine--D-glutamate ligase